MTTPDPSVHDEHWYQFAAMIDLHKFYFDVILKAGGFALAAISVLTAYIVRTMNLAGIGGPWLKLGLLMLPFMFAAATAAVFWIGARKAREFSDDVIALHTQWGYRWRPHTELLGWMALVFAVVFTILAMGMGAYGTGILAAPG